MDDSDAPLVGVKLELDLSTLRAVLQGLHKRVDSLENESLRSSGEFGKYRQTMAQNIARLEANDDKLLGKADELAGQEAETRERLDAAAHQLSVQEVQISAMNDGLHRVKREVGAVKAIREDLVGAQEMFATATPLRLPSPRPALAVPRSPAPLPSVEVEGVSLQAFDLPQDEGGSSSVVVDDGSAAARMQRQLMQAQEQIHTQQALIHAMNLQLVKLSDKVNNSSVGPDRSIDDTVSMLETAVHENLVGPGAAPTPNQQFVLGLRRLAAAVDGKAPKSELERQADAIDRIQRQLRELNGTADDDDTDEAGLSVQDSDTERAPRIRRSREHNHSQRSPRSPRSSRSPGPSVRPATAPVRVEEVIAAVDSDPTFASLVRDIAQKVFHTESTVLRAELSQPASRALAKPNGESAERDADSELTDDSHLPLSTLAELKEAMWRVRQDMSKLRTQANENTLAVQRAVNKQAYASLSMAKLPIESGESGEMVEAATSSSDATDVEARTRLGFVTSDVKALSRVVGALQVKVKELDDVTGVETRAEEKSLLEDVDQRIRELEGEIEHVKAGQASRELHTSTTVEELQRQVQASTLAMELETNTNYGDPAVMRRHFDAIRRHIELLTATKVDVEKARVALAAKADVKLLKQKAGKNFVDRSVEHLTDALTKLQMRMDAAESNEFEQHAGASLQRVSSASRRGLSDPDYIHNQLATKADKRDLDRVLNFLLALGASVEPRAPERGAKVKSTEVLGGIVTKQPMYMCLSCDRPVLQFEPHEHIPRMPGVTGTQANPRGAHHSKQAREDRTVLYSQDPIEARAQRAAKKFQARHVGQQGRRQDSSLPGLPQTDSR
jgi:Domain of unknown function (DUF4795)